MHRELKMLPMGTRDSALRVKMLPMGTQGKKRKPRQMVASCSPKLRSDPTFKPAFFCHWAPTPAPEPSPGLRLCRGIAAALPARNSRAPARLLEAAELLEADQRKHEGGQSKKKKKKKKKKEKKKKKKKKKKKIKIERSTSGTIYAQCTLPDRPPTAAN